MTRDQLSTLRKLAEAERDGFNQGTEIGYQYKLATNPAVILELLDTLERSLGLLGFYANGGNPNYDVWVSEDKFYFTGKRAREFLASLEGGDGE